MVEVNMEKIRLAVTEAIQQASEAITGQLQADVKVLREQNAKLRLQNGDLQQKLTGTAFPGNTPGGASPVPPLPTTAHYNWLESRVKELTANNQMLASQLVNLQQQRSTGVGNGIDWRKAYTEAMGRNVEYGKKMATRINALEAELNQAKEAGDPARIESLQQQVRVKTHQVDFRDGMIAAMKGFARAQCPHHGMTQERARFWLAGHDSAFRWIKDTLPAARAELLDRLNGFGYALFHLRDADPREVAGTWRTYAGKVLSGEYSVKPPSQA